MLYAVTYAYIRPEARPSPGVQAFTLVFYAVALAGLALNTRRDPDPSAAAVGPEERRTVGRMFGATLLLGVTVSFLDRRLVFLPVLVIFWTWVALSVAFVVVALADGVRQRAGTAPDGEVDSRRRARASPQPRARRVVDGGRCFRAIARACCSPR